MQFMNIYIYMIIIFRKNITDKMPLYVLSCGICVWYTKFIFCTFYTFLNTFFL